MARTKGGTKVRRTLSARALLHIPVPQQWRALLGTDTKTVVEYTDNQGGKWRVSGSSQEWRCSWCGRWQTGLYYSHPPIVACERHFRVED